MFIPVPDELNSIPVISPSRARDLLDPDGCRLRVLLSVDGNGTRGIPLSGQVILGNLIHRLYDYSQTPNHDWQGAKLEWDALLEDVEERLSENPLDNSLLPISGMKHYTMISRSAMRRATQMRDDIQPPDAVSDIGHRHRVFGSEVRVWWSDDGTILNYGDAYLRGMIDLVQTNGGELVITDYKTGAMHDEGGQLKQEYEFQLKLYAALLNSTRQATGWESWFPDRAQVEHAITSEVVEVRLIEAESIDMIEQLIAKREDINAALLDIDNPDELFALATPSLETCRFCSFRTSCAPYQKNLEQWMQDDASEIYDVIGTLVEQPKAHHPDSPLMSLVIEDVQGDKWRVIRLDSLAERNEALQDTQLGSRVGVFGCRRTPISLPVIGINHVVEAHQRSHVVYSSV